MRASISLLVFFMIATILPKTIAEAQVQKLDWPLEVVSDGHGFTEGASLGPDGTIYFSDMDNQKILRFDPGSGTTAVWQEESGKTNGLYILNKHLYGCEAGGRAVVEYDLDKGPGSRKVLASSFQKAKFGCPNDITVIGDMLYFSEFWIPSFHMESGEKREIFRNRVYVYSFKKKSLDSLEFNFDTPNGVASSPDGSFLFIGDVQANKLYRARLKKGKAGPLEVLADLDKLGLKGPDGMTIHKDGRIFLALYRSDKLLVLNPDGSPIGYLPTGPLSTNCIFAADGKTLYITADRKLKRVIIP
jgi:gluconolactonase